MSAWVLIVYRVPTEPASRRVAIWRRLKRMGGLYLQQCACLFPARPGILAELEEHVAAITESGGSATLFDIPTLRPGDEERMVAALRDLRNTDYAEIIEECETKFVREVEFEHFRENYSYAESEEIREDLDKIERWYQRVVDRDWFCADRREEAAAWITRCGELLAAFEQEVYRRQEGDLAPAFGAELAHEAGADPAPAPETGETNGEAI